MSVCIFVPADQAGPSSSADDGGDNEGTTEELIIDNLQQALQHFWTKVSDDVRKINADDFKAQALPLARIKKIMKLDEDVKMISSEAPVLFAKAAEMFILELTLRAWSHTEDNKRRTLQRNDIAMAISKSDQFDFLIDIVPRNEVKPTRPREETSRPCTSTEQVIQQVPLSSPTQQQYVLPQYVCQPSSSQNATIVQQLVAPSTEVHSTQLPIQLTQAQLNMIRLQVQQNPNQPIIIQAQQQQQSPQIIQVSSQGHQPQQQVYLAQVATSQEES